MSCLCVNLMFVRSSGVAVGEWVEVEWALVMRCSMAWHLHSWSYSGCAMSVMCQVRGALLLLDENVEWMVCVGVQ
jgi:hypothetical protein